MAPRWRMASWISAVPTARAVCAGIAWVKKIHTCAPGTGLGDLQRSGDACSSGGLDVRQGVEHRGLAVEVGSQPPAGVVREHRVQANEQVLPRPRGQVLRDDVRSQREQTGGRASHTLAPPTRRHGHPPLLSRARVLPVPGVGVVPGTEQVQVEGELLLRRRVCHRHQPAWPDRGRELLGRERGVLAS